MPVIEPDCFWQTTDGETVRLYQGDVVDVLRRLPAESVQLVITSPPYWGLRAYLHDGHDDKHREIGAEPLPDCGAWTRSPLVPCGRGCFVCTMVEVFREVRRVLRVDGILALNLGDSYGGNSQLQMVPARTALALQADGWTLRSDVPWVKRSPMPESVTNRPAKALEYIFVFAKKAGYYWDGEAVKRVSVTEPHPRGGVAKSGQTDGPMDRNGSSQFDEKEQERVYGDEGSRNFRQADLWFESIDSPHGLTHLDDEIVGLDVTSQGYEGAHFATFPPRLVEPFVKAATSEHGACAECGTPWRRVVERRREATRPGRDTKVEDGDGERMDGKVIGNRDPERHCTTTETVGWQPGCECFLDRDDRCRECGADWSVERPEPFGADWNAKKRAEGTVGEMGNSKQDRLDDEERLSAPRHRVEREMPCECFADRVRPCVVLDPFVGSGTACVVALAHGRWSWGIDLSAKYLTCNAIPRVEGALLKRPALTHLAGDLRRGAGASEVLERMIKARHADSPEKKRTLRDILGK